MSAFGESSMCRLFHWHRLPFALLLIQQHALPTLANTEIINFSAGNPIPVLPFPRHNWTVLHSGENEIIVRDRIPAPLSDSGAPLSNPFCDNDEDAMDLLRGSSNPPRCPHDLWVVLDMDGDGRHGHDGHSAWKNYDRFTLRVSWPASVSLEIHRPVVSSPAPSSSARTDSMAPRRLHLARIRLKQEGIPIPGTRKRKHRKEGVPFVVLLEPLVLGVLPTSMLPTVVTLLVLLGVTACSVVPYVLRSVLGEVVESARKELALLGERKKERVD